MIGQTISHYRILSELGHGAMGLVYLAEDLNLERRVAIKTLNLVKGSDSQHLRRRFQREAEAVAKLKHPHIATIYEFGRTPEGEPFIVMEYVDGDNLADLMLKETLTIPRSLQIIKEVAEALGEAHHHGIVHRDIKPSNIAINRDGQVRVLDFGLAKQIELETANPFDPERQTLLNTQTREGMIVGTPLYLSPEQALGIEVDARSDLFSLGSLLYECISGRPAFSGMSAIEICAKVIRDDPPPPSEFNPLVSAELDRQALKALAKKPSERYQSAEEMIADLSGVQASLRDGSGANKVTQRLAPIAPRPRGLSTISDIFTRPRFSAGYVIVGLLVLGVIAFASWRVTRAKPHKPTDEAQRLFDQGVNALQEGAYYKATNILKRAVAADPKFALALPQRAGQYSKQCKRRVTGIEPEARALLRGYDWPGNVRELENAIERAVVLGSTELITPEDLPEAMFESSEASGLPINKYYDAIKEAKKQLIVKALEQTEGNYTEAAKLLGVHANNLHRLIRSLNLRPALKIDG